MFWLIEWSSFYPSIAHLIHLSIYLSIYPILDDLLMTYNKARIYLSATLFSNIFYDLIKNDIHWVRIKLIWSTDLLSFLEVVFKQTSLEFHFPCLSVWTINGDKNVSVRPCSILHTGSDSNFILNCNKSNHVYDWRIKSVMQVAWPSGWFEIERSLVRVLRHTAISNFFLQSRV